MFKPKVITLGGMRVVLVRSDRQSIFVEAMVMSGSREEKKSVGGVAHFLEHMSGRGTKSFPGANDLGEAVDWVGGARNAYTGHDSMGYWTRTAKEKFELAVKMTAEEVVCPILPAEQLEKERSTIIEEIRMYEDDPSSKSSETMWRLYYGDTGMGRGIAGTEKTVGALQSADLWEYRKSFYTADNTILGVVGDWDDEDKLIATIEKEFGEYLQTKSVQTKRDAFDPSRAGLGLKKLIKRKVDQAHLSIGFKGLTANDPRRYAMALLNIVLGSSWSSRLYKEIRLKRGLAYSVGSGAESFLDSGLEVVGGGIRKESLKEAYELIGKIVEGLSDPKSEFVLTKADLEMAKECYKGRVSFNFDNPEKVMSTALADLFCGRAVRTAEEIKAKIEEVKLEEMIDLAAEVFEMDKATVAVVGDYKEIPI